jgi:hypothetical protein
VLGPDRGREVFRQGLAETRMAGIGSAQDLLTLADAIQRRGGVEGAVGSILGFQALLRGAGRPRASASRAGTARDEEG